jgi:hypothetical protein
MITQLRSRFNFGPNQPDLTLLPSLIEKHTGIVVTLQKDELSDVLVCVRYLLYVNEFPQLSVHISAYKPGGIRKIFEIDHTVSQKTQEDIEGYDESEMNRNVYLMGYVPPDPTLFYVTEIILEDMGGCKEKPVEKDIRMIYDRKTSVDELRERIADSNWLIKEIKRLEKAVS